MLAVNDMFVMAKSRVASLFIEDVEEFLRTHQVRYFPRIKVTGKTGYDHAFNFLIPPSERRPARVVQAFNAPQKDWVTAYIFAVTDVRNARDEHLDAYAFLNDSDRTVGGDVGDALKEYDIKPAPWSRRDDFVEELAA